MLPGLELSRCLLCGSTGFPGTQCDTCIIPRPQFDDTVVAAKCPRCTTPLEILNVGSGSGTRIFACMSCRWSFLPPRAWSMILGDASIAAEIETRVPLPTIRVDDSLPMMKCPSCAKPMDRARFAATSGSVIDVCRFQHGVWVDVGELRKIVVYEPSRDDDKPQGHRDHPEVAERIMRANRAHLEKVHAATRRAPNLAGVSVVFIIAMIAIVAGLHFIGKDCSGLTAPIKLND